MNDEVRVILYGVGEIGGSIAKNLLKRKGYRIVGAIEIRKDIVGRDLGDVLGLGKGLGVEVSDKSDETLQHLEADIVLLTTGSYLNHTYPQIIQCLKSSLNVISTCEELSYPWIKYPEISSKIDKYAKDNDATVLGTGINPGFLMDTLPIILTSPCLSIQSIKVKRVMYSGNRRIPYQKKIGSGLSKDEFEAKIKSKEITGHVGLFESTALIASTLGWNLDEITEIPPEPILAEKELRTSYINIKPRYVAGLKCSAYGTTSGKKVIELEFVSHAGVNEPYDEVLIDGEPSIRERIIGGVHGDTGTTAMIINMIPKVISARPGLLTMKDFALLSATPEDARIYLSR